MEDERGFGNILFYIIAAIIAIISSVRSKKKQQATLPGDGYPGDTADTDFPEEIFGEEQTDTLPGTFLPGEGAPPSDYSYETFPESKGVDEGSYEEPLAAQFAREGVSALDAVETARRYEELIRSASTFDSIMDADAEEEQNAGFYVLDNLQEEFEPIKAVIYSEILNRKEY
ncbi:MAG: hypothetical protein RBS37_00785 [Bacteroidales bacterium]|jgi:hypothetical protein|nr:hypothetical protein [Bacteroidales bacterium]